MTTTTVPASARLMRRLAIGVHGAWPNTSSRNGVIESLQDDGYPVVAVANPLRSLSGNAAYLSRYLDTLSGPIVLVGHSYGAAVVTNAATGDPDVRALVYVNASVHDESETVASLAGPDSALSVPDPTTVFDAVPANVPAAPTTDVYLKTATFLTEFANGLPRKHAAVLVAAQRPITLGALKNHRIFPAWRTNPSWYLVGTQDYVIPPSAQRTMAGKAGAVVAEFKAGHLGLVSDPRPVAQVIERAVKATASRLLSQRRVQ